MLSQGHTRQDTCLYPALVVSWILPLRPRVLEIATEKYFSGLLLEWREMNFSVESPCSDIEGLHANLLLYGLYELRCSPGACARARLPSNFATLRTRELQI